MPKIKKNNLDNRREFYIHRIVRDGRVYDNDEEERLNPIIQVEAPKSVNSVETIVRATLNKPETNENKTVETLEKVEKEIIEEPVIDEEIGYYDEGVFEETVISNRSEVVYDEQPGYYNDIINSVDDIYRGIYNNDEEPKEVIDVDFEQEVYEEKTPTPITENTKKTVTKDEVVPKVEFTSPAPVTPVKTKPIFKKKTKYVAPPLDLLTKSDAKNAENIEVAEHQKEVINNTFVEAGIRASVEKYIFGPTVTQFLISIDKGANVKDIRKVESNLLMYLECESIRIQTPIPGKPFAGIEVPKKPENRRTVFLGDMIAHKNFKNNDMVVPVAVGQDNYGIYHYIDLTEMPHGLVAGTTKSGKSVCLNTFIISLLYRFTPEELRIVLIDPKRIELGVYDGIPHLAMPVIVDQEDFESALGWVFDEMDRRYKEFQVYDEINIVDYNAVRRERKEPTMPHIIVIMDEFSDWFADASSQVELYMQKLAAKARAAGINIILATQRPSKDVIKGTIKANFDTRIAFRVSSFDDAKVIMGYGGAERLEGRGDMLIRYAGRAEQRLQGAFIPNSNIKAVTRFLRENNTTDYIVTQEEIHQSTVARQVSTPGSSKAMGRTDPKFEEIAFYVVRNKNASVNQITQVFGTGFNRMNDIFLALEDMGVVSRGVKGKQREVLIDEFQLRSLLEAED